MRDVDYELLKSERMKVILRIRAITLEAVRDWFNSHGFIHVQTPVLVPVSQELESSSFRVQYFDKEAHLAQGACPYLEVFMARLGKVYTITPAFRAERLSTKRHLTEFWRVECLVPLHNLADIMEVLEMLITDVCRYLAKEATEELHILKRDLSSINLPFPRISYNEAIEILQEDGTSLFWGQEIEAEHEEHLSKKSDKPLFISHYPLGVQTFFLKSCPQKKELALVADLLAPEGYGEIATCGQMIDDVEELTSKLRFERTVGQNYRWYLNLKRTIAYPYSIFAIGIERLLMWICGLKHVGETTMFPRMPQLVFPDVFLKNALTCSRYTKRPVSLLNSGDSNS
jgi:asparaginyl-tRNA synthetase